MGSVLDCAEIWDSSRRRREERGPRFTVRHHLASYLRSAELDFSPDRLIVRLWTLIFSGSPKKIREEELESARRLAPAAAVFKNGSKREDTEGVPQTRPDDDDIDPNDIPPATSTSSVFGGPQLAPEFDLENAFDEDEEDDY